MVPEGTNAAIFDDFIEDIFQKLEETYPGQKKYIIMDNVKFHKSPIIKERFNNSIHETCFLPPYSLVFNPIESCFNKLKNYIKKSLGVEKKKRYILS
jgi:transposase